MRGDRITLTANTEALGHRHHAGDQGTVEKMHTDGLTVRMDDGRHAFPTHDEVITEQR